MQYLSIPEPEAIRPPVGNVCSTTAFEDIYGQNSDSFIEDNGRKFFLLYLKLLINGIGNYYIEAQTRDDRRMDIIVDYLERMEYGYFGSDESAPQRAAVSGKED